MPIIGANRHKAEVLDRVLRRNESGAIKRCKEVAHLSGNEDARPSVELRERNNAGTENRLAIIFKPMDGKLRGMLSLIDAGTNHQ